MVRLPQHGYTILEVMIFLATTGVLFASAAVAVGGSQRQAQYSQAVRDFETQIKDVANDAANGFYPAYERGRCRVNGATGKIDFDLSVLGSPGSSTDCINIGKTLMFNLGEEDSFSVGTLVGINPPIGQSVDLSLSALRPTIAYKNAGTQQIDLTVRKPIRFGASVTKIGLVGDDSKEYSSLSFITDFNANSVVSENGTLTTNVYGIEGDLDDFDSIGGPNSYQSEIETFGDGSSAVTVNPNQGFYICLLTTDNRRARTIIGVDGVVTATKSEFDLPPGGVCP
jgi:type II secretory pathway pseudopilin PulG